MAEASGAKRAKQQRAIAALLDPACATNAMAAERAGVSKRQLQTWLAEDDAFVAALHAAEAEIVSHATRRLLLLVDASIDALAGALTDETKYSLRAAQLVLTHVLAWRDVTDFETRLAALENE